MKKQKGPSDNKKSYQGLPENSSEFKRGGFCAGTRFSRNGRFHFVSLLLLKVRRTTNGRFHCVALLLLKVTSLNCWHFYPPRLINCIYISYSSTADLRLFELEKNENNRDGDSKDVADYVSAKTKHSGWHKFFKLWKKGSGKKLPSFPPVAMPTKISRRLSRSGRENVEADRSVLNSTWKTFTLAHLKAATNNFSQGWLLPIQ